MRIIAGEHRGRRLLPPEGDVTRPITDRVKQSLFDIIAPLIPGAVVYDCFAGTGSLGLECLSRGASSVLLLEADRSAVQRLRKNVQTLDSRGVCRVVAGDLFQWFAAAEAAAGPRADLLFLDPPYRFLTDRSSDLRDLSSRLVKSHLNPAATLIFRHDSEHKLALPGLCLTDERDYGGMRIELLTPASP